jgi:dipeptidyl aminopeptidase/acylaminoacyl peptidase
MLLTWTDNSLDETSFRIERSLSLSGFAEVAVVGADITGYPDTGLNPLATYYYRVRACNTQGCSSYSNIAVGTPVSSSATGKIAFTSGRVSDGFGDIYVMDADGTHQTRLTSSPSKERQPAWSPDGSKIAFQSTQIYVMNADGTDQINLTPNHPYYKDSNPAWSPDGSKIAFTYYSGGYYNIYVMNADGTGQTVLTNSIADNEPAWSPDGSKIAFASVREGNWEIYVMNADGTGQTNLSNNSLSLDWHPAWSPDGSKIAFTSDRDGNYEIYVMNADGTGQTNLSNNPSYDMQPAWSLVPIVTCSFDPVPQDPIRLIRGAKLNFWAAVHNNEDTTQAFKFATKIKKPDGNWYPHYLIPPTDVTLNAHTPKSKYLTLSIPASAPYGTYTYFGYVGVAGPPVVKYNECQFTFEVVP